MTHYEKLRKRLNRWPYLIADMDGTVRLTGEVAPFNTISEAFPSALILDARSALENFAALPVVGKDDRTFAANEISKILGCTPGRTSHYIAECVLVPSIQAVPGKRGSGSDGEIVYSWLDGYCAGVIGSLRRHHLPVKVLKKVQPLFTKPIPKKKRIARKRATTRRP